MNNKIFAKKIEHKYLLQHKNKRNTLIKFLLLLFIFLIYFIFITQKYGIQQGFFVSILTWSFFVLCTPIADAGFLIDFPLRLITRIKMIFAEIFVWIVAISLNLYTYFLNPEVYEKTKILTLFRHILGHPLPFWIIIFLAMIGTFISIKFGDEILDTTKNKKDRELYQKYKHNYRLIIMIFIFAITLIVYNFLLKKLGVNLPI